MLRFAVALLLVGSALAQTLNLSASNKYGNSSILDTTCDKDTQIDFYFSSSSNSNCAAGGVCTSSSLDSSYLKFLDINGNDLVLLLSQVQLAGSGPTITGLSPTPAEYFIFVFKNSSVTNQVYVMVPVTATASNSSNVFKATSYPNSLLAGLDNLTESLTLDIFNYLDKTDFTKFYTATNSAKTQTVLLSTSIIQVSYLATSAPSTGNAFNFVAADSTGNKLCYGSLQTQGLFQTHLRESWPLWTCIISVFFYWLFYLLTESDLHTVFDNKYENNKWTNWGFYSLHNLAHIEFFTRLTRVSNMYFTFMFQAMVLAALYSTLGEKKTPYTNYQMIIWTAAIALVSSLPLPFILGGVFLQPIYKTTLQKFIATKKTKGTMLKKTADDVVLTQKIDKMQQKLYTLYYWYYIVIFAGFVCFWVSSIYMMMYIYRDWYYLHRIWLASLGITFVLDNLIFDPLLTALLGNTRFYKLRGYFYDFRLGQQFKQIEE